MTLSDHKKFYSRFLSGHEGKLHFAAHSHHFWPDVTREAHLSYWDDCARTSDEKWGKIFGEVISKAQAHIARILKLQDKNQITFAPNTHELAVRVLSLFLGSPSLRILTTSSEFHSWKRQLQRLQEIPEIKVDLVNTEKFLTRRQEVLAELKTKLTSAPDLFFISQVFFDSGLAWTESELNELVMATPRKTLIVIDGYHGFAAIPTNLSKLEGRIFYLGGGYKYAQAGEGACFLVVPKGDWRPAYTGWFAGFGDLSKPAGKEVGYTNDGLAFMGATQDPSGLYRFNATWDLFQREGLEIEAIHQHVVDLQKAFLRLIPESFFKDWKLTPLFDQDLGWHGHFLTYEAPSEALAESFESTLKKHNIIIDRRGRRLRFGFGLYHNLGDLEALAEQIQGLSPA